MQKLQSLQVLRAVAALLVVWAHAIDVPIEHGAMPVQAQIGSLQNFGAVGVDIFFVISGFIVSLTALRATSWQAFFVDRLKRIWPTYALASALLVLLGIASAGTADGGKFLLSLLFLQVPGNSQTFPTHPLGWSLMFEMWFYVLIAGLLAAGLRARLPAALLGVLAGLLVLGGLTGYGQPFNILTNPIILEFAFGVALGMAWRTGPQPRALGLGAFVAGAGLLLLSALRGYGEISEAQYTLDASLSVERLLRWGIPAGLLVGGALFAFPGQVRGRLGQLLVYLGDASYSIYLFSFLALILVGKFWSVFSVLGPDMGVLLGFLAATVSGVAGYELIEKPLGRVLKKRRAPAVATA